MRTFRRETAILSEHEFSDSFYIVMKKNSYFNVVLYRIGFFMQSTDCNSRCPQLFWGFLFNHMHYLTTNCGYRELL